VVVTKLDLLRIVEQIGEKALGCVALRKGVRRALLELRLYRYERRRSAERARDPSPRSRKANPIRLEGLTTSIGESRYSQAGGIEFVDENGGGPGVRLRKQTKQRR
jgi:hypothetical protein